MPRPALLTLVSIPLLALSACLPVTLPISPTGKAALARHEGIFAVDLEAGTAELVHEAGPDEQGAWASWGADGASILYALRRGDRHVLRMREAAGETRELYDGAIPLAQVAGSPTGEHVAFVLAPDAALPVLVVVEVRTKREVVRAAQVAPPIAWDPSGQTLYGLRLTDEVDLDTGVRQGQLCTLDLRGEATPLARVAVRHSFHLDYSASAKLLAFTALGADADPAKPVKPIEPDLAAAGEHNRLFLRGADGRLVMVDQPRPTIAIWNPAGDRLLTNLSGETEQLLIVDPAARPPKVEPVTGKVALRTERLVDATPILPAWGPTGLWIVCWRYQATIGLGGMSLRAFKLDLKTGKETSLEPMLEQAVQRALGR